MFGRRNQLSQVRLARFLCRIEEGYPNNPYHSRIHAADVLRNLYCILTQGGLLHAVWQDSPDMGLLMAFLSAIVHDYEHKGVNNDYLIKTHDELALTYNDRSPMENHHLVRGWRGVGEGRGDLGPQGLTWVSLDCWQHSMFCSSWHSPVALMHFLSVAY